MPRDADKTRTAAEGKNEANSHDDEERLCVQEGGSGVLEEATNGHNGNSIIARQCTESEVKAEETMVSE